MDTTTTGAVNYIGDHLLRGHDRLIGFMFAVIPPTQLTVGVLIVGTMTAPLIFTFGFGSAYW
jgi:hypothetical protein